MGKVQAKFLNGYPGEISRQKDDVIESFPNGEASAAIEFGAPVALNAGKAMNVSASYTNVIGVATRNVVKTEKAYAANEAHYEKNELVDVIKRGSVVIRVPEAAEPAEGGLVYITKATGAYATAADSSNTITTNWKFKGAKDSNNCVEIVIPERVF